MSEWRMNLDDLRNSIEDMDGDEESFDIELILATILRSSQDLYQSEARFRMFVEESSDGIWSATFGRGVPITLSCQEQASLMLELSVVDYCNPAMARMYGFDSYQSMIRHPKDELMPPDDPRNHQYLERFVASSYRIRDEMTFERDRFGNELAILNSVVGRVENGNLVRAWGVQRIAKPSPNKLPIHSSAILAAIKKRLEQYTGDCRLPDEIRKEIEQLAGEIDYGS